MTNSFKHLKADYFIKAYHVKKNVMVVSLTTMLKNNKLKCNEITVNNRIIGLSLLRKLSFLIIFFKLRDIKIVHTF